MSRIFVNYRRSDAAAHANLLYDWLRERYGEERVFKDLDTIEPGLDFADAIDRAVNSSAVMLAVIGPEWLVGADGRSRLADPDDYVRLEIEGAFARGIRVIPVLVGGTPMPAATDLPESLRPLTRRHAFELSDARSRVDREELLRRLDLIVGRAEKAPEEEPRTRSRAERYYDWRNARSKALFLLEVRLVTWPFRVVWRLVRAARRTGRTTAAPSS